MNALKLVLGTWIGMGILAVGYSTFLTSFASVHTADGKPRIALGDSQDNAGLNEAARLWSEERGAAGDVFTAGRAAYDIADQTRDPKWAGEASRRLAEAREVLPGFGQATAWQGAANALIARDYPLQGAWQALPGPFFVRIYHIERAEALLNEAVRQTPDDPVVRLLRAATLSRLPEALVDREIAMEDFALLAEWRADPASNPENAAVLVSSEWQLGFLDAYAQAKAALGDRQMAETLRAQASSLLEN